MRYLRKYLPHNFYMRKYWSKMAMEKEDVCQNTIIEDVILKNIDRHFFENEDGEKKKDSDLNNEEDVEDQFKQKAEGEKQEDNEMNNDNNNDNIQIDESNNDQDARDDLQEEKGDSKDQINNKGSNLAKQEQDEMELIKFKEQVDQFKLQLIQINKGHQQN